MKFFLLILSFYCFHGVNAQIKLDLDFDDKLDEVYLTTVGDNSVKMMCLLSTQDYQAISSKVIDNRFPEGFFTIKNDGGKVKIGFHLNYVERLHATFEYDRFTASLVLVNIERSVDGDNDINETGSSSLDVVNHKYIGEWTYYDYRDDVADEYRIEMPKITKSMDFPKIKMEEFSEQIFLDYRKQCKNEYKKQLTSIFPNGNNFVNGELYVDLNDDYSVDSIYLDTYTSRLKSRIFDGEKYVNISSEPTGFYADDNFEILAHDGQFVLQSNVGAQRVELMYDQAKQRFVVLGSRVNNLIDSDLDGDGIKDSVHVQRVDDQLQYICQLSSQGFSKVKSGLFYGLEAKVDATSPNLLLEVFFSRSGVNALFKYNAHSQSMQLANIDSWSIYDDIYQNLNLETGIYSANRVVDEQDTLLLKTTLQLPEINIQSFGDDFLAKYYETTSELWNKATLHKELTLGFSIIDDFLAVFADEPFELEGRSFLGCEVKMRITDSKGIQQDFFVSNFDLDGLFVAMFDNEIHYTEQLGYYIEESTSIFPKGLTPGWYKLQIIISHPDFFEDIVSNVVEYRIKK